MTAVPDRGTDTDVGELLREIDRRLQAHLHHPATVRPGWSLADLLQCLLGLAWYCLLDSDGARPRWEQHLDWLGQLRHREDRRRR